MWPSKYATTCRGLKLHAIQHPTTGALYVTLHIVTQNGKYGLANLSTYYTGYITQSLMSQPPMYDFL